MPWRSVRPNPAGGQNLRRYSFMEKTHPSAVDGQQGANPVRPTPSPADSTERQSISRQSSHSATRNLTAATQELPDMHHAGKDMSSRLRPNDTTTAPRSHRHGLFRSRHASDSKLSMSYNTSAPDSGPPPDNPLSSSPTCSPIDHSCWLTLVSKSTNHHHYRTHCLSFAP